jgi:hypothetical protein
VFIIEDTADKSDPEEVLLDQCTIRADPPLDFHLEHLTLPEHLMTQFNMHLEGSETNNGLVISSKLPWKLDNGLVISSKLPWKRHLIMFMTYPVRNQRFRWRSPFSRNMWQKK